MSDQLRDLRRDALMLRAKIAGIVIAELLALVATMVCVGRALQLFTHNDAYATLWAILGVAGMAFIGICMNTVNHHLVSLLDVTRAAARALAAQQRGPQ